MVRDRCVSVSVDVDAGRELQTGTEGWEVWHVVVSRLRDTSVVTAAVRIARVCNSPSRHDTGNVDAVTVLL